MFANRRTVRIEWGHCDAAGIVFYPRYFEMFDASAHHLFEAAGWTHRELRARFDMVGIPMVDTRARFLLPSSFDDDIVIETRVAAIRNSSFDLEHRVFKPSPTAARSPSRRGRPASGRECARTIPCG